MLILALCLCLLPAADGAPTVVTFDNGFRLVLVPNGASPMTASVVTVRTGLREESAATNGVSHMLEHLLFNGTQSRTQEQLYADAERLGMYNNANTNEDYTAFMILVENASFARGLEIQADMLLRSTIPEDKIPKEKKIVIEEMVKDRAHGSEEDPAVRRANVFQSTPYAREVIGSEPSVNALTREQILAHYHTYYVPNNMTALVSGRFAPDEMIALYRRLFGTQPARPLPPVARLESPLSHPARAEATTRKDRSVLTLTYPAPGADSPDRTACSLLASLLADRQSSPVARAVQALDGEVSCRHDFNRDFGLLELTCEIPSLVPDDVARQTIAAALRSIRPETFAGAPLAREITSRKTDELTLLEQPHYLGLMKAQSLADLDTPELDRLCGPPYLEALAAIPPERIAALAARLAETEPSVTLYRPESGAAPPPQTVLWEANGERLVRFALPGGATLLVDQSPTAGVLAVHVLLEHRSAVEPAGKEGIADLTHRLLAKGTRERDAAELSSALAEIGAQLKCVDDENIPYDDYQTSPRFSYVRFQTLDEFFLRGIALLGEILARPRFAADDFAAARDTALRIAAKDAKNAQAVATRAFLARVAPALGAQFPVYGSDASLRAITLDDVRAFHAQYFRPGNMIIAVATSLPPELVARAIEKALAGLPQTPPPAPREAGPTSAAATALGSERAYVIAGRAVHAPADDRAALEIAAAIANQRTSFELRERQGLAYSMGARVEIAGDAGWFSVGLGTRAEQADHALAELTKELDRLSATPPTQDELERARSEILRQRLMRELTRMGRAYAIGVAAFAGDPLRAPDVEIERFKSVSLEALQRVMREHLGAGEWISVIAR